MKMKRICKSLLGLSAIAMLGMVSSCSDQGTSDLLSLAGDDATVVAIVNPVKVLESAGAEVTTGGITIPRELSSMWSSREKATVKNILSVEGYDYEQVLVVVYDKGSFAAARVKDENKLVKSLKKAGLRKESVGSYTAYTTGDEYDPCFIVNEGFIYMVDKYWNDEDAGETMDRMLEYAETPLADWKVEKMQGNADKDVNLLACVDEDQIEVALAIGVQFDGAKMRGKYAVYDLDGKEYKGVVKSGDVAQVGKFEDYLNDKDNVVFACGGLSDEKSSIYEIMEDAAQEFGLSRQMSREIPREAREYLDKLTGGFFIDINMPDVSTRRYEKLSSYNAIVGLQFVKGEAEEVYKDLHSMLKDTGLKVRRGDKNDFTVTIPEVGDVIFDIKGDLITARTEGYKGKSSLSGKLSGADCMLCFNIPKEFSLLKDYGIKTGMKGYICTTGTEGEFEVEFMDTKKPFIANILDIVKKIN